MESPFQEVPTTPSLMHAQTSYFGDGIPSPDAVVPDYFPNQSQGGSSSYSVPGTPVTPYRPAACYTPSSNAGVNWSQDFQLQSTPFRTPKAYSKSPYVDSRREQLVPTTPLSSVARPSPGLIVTKDRLKVSSQNRPGPSNLHFRNHTVDASGDHVTLQMDDNKKDDFEKKRTSSRSSSQKRKQFPEQASSNSRQNVARFRKSPEAFHRSRDTQASPDLLDLI